MRCVSALRACSSGVILGRFFFAILLLQQPPDRVDVGLDVARESHDSRDVAVVDQLLDERIVAVPMRRHKWPITACPPGGGLAVSPSRPGCNSYENAIAFRGIQPRGRTR